MKTIKNFIGEHKDIFYGILATVLMAGWIGISLFVFLFVVGSPDSLIFKIFRAAMTMWPPLGIYYYLGDHRINKEKEAIKLEHSSVLDDFLIKK